MLKFSKPGFSNMWTMNFQMFKLALEKAEEPEIKLPTFTGSSKKQESSRKPSISALLTMPKPFTVWITIYKLWRLLQEMVIPDHLICLLRNLYVGQESTVRTLQSCHLAFLYTIPCVSHMWFLTIISFMIFMSRLESGLVQIFIRPKSLSC